MRITFVTGGARSGKSRFAQDRAQRLGGDAVTFIATATVQADDDEMRNRVQLHQAERPSEWVTLEAPHGVAAALLAAPSEVVLLDCLSLLVSNALLQGGENTVSAEVEALLQAAESRAGQLLVVSNEVGSGVVPPYPLGRAFRDALGRANQRVAAASREAYLVVAGLPLTLKQEP